MTGETTMNYRKPVTGRPAGNESDKGDSFGGFVESLQDRAARESLYHSRERGETSFRGFIRQFEVEPPIEAPSHLGYIMPEEPSHGTFTLLGLFGSAGGFVGQVFTVVIGFFFYGTLFCVALLFVLTAVAALVGAL